MKFDYVILVDSYKPINNSAAVMIDELAFEISKNSKVCVITEDSKIKHCFSLLKESEQCYVLRIRTLRRYRSNLLRGISELINPYLMLAIFFTKRLEKKVSSKNLIWYSPTIFYSPLIKYFKKKFGSKTYLILRDMFPLWMVDLKLIRENSITHKFLKHFEKKQYKLADSIGVQIDSNVKIVKRIVQHHTDVHVLNNWKALKKQYIKKNITSKIVGVYAGNIGVAQGMSNFENIINLSEKNNFNITFYSKDIFFENLKIKHKHSQNLSFKNTVSNYELEKKYKEMHFGFVLLDKSHSTNNIPGKFISYMSNGLPVFCILNKNNPLNEIVNHNKLGIALYNTNEDNLQKQWEKFVNLISHNDINKNCYEYAIENFDVSEIANKIVTKLN